MNFEISDRWTALAAIELITKAGATSIPDKSTVCDWFEAASNWCVDWSRTVLLTMALNSGVDVFIQATWDILNIHRDIK